MADENRVFDVARPGRTAPEPTAKPVIVGHHPMQSDPMVKEGPDLLDFGTESTPTKISVTDDSSSEHHLEGPDLSLASESDSKPEEPQAWNMPAAESPPEPAGKANSPDPVAPAETPPAPEIPPTAEEPAPVDAPAPAEEPAPIETPSEASEPASDPEPAGGDDTQPQPPAVDDSPVPEDPTPPQMAHVEALHFEPRRRGGGMKWLILALLLILVAAYLAIDAGLIASGVKLPFHIFKQKAAVPTASTTPPASTKQNTQAAVSNLPSGFSKYTLNGTDISFAAPSTWGVPNSATEDGYSTRSTSSKADGVYAYLVTFPNNKDVQIAVTSSKFLPPARGAQYYDFLQWCIGTNDGKIYKSVLNFTTAGGVSTPSTISCDQGPLTDAAKLSTNSIVQPKAKDSSGAVIGDLYTKNLSETSLPVFRIKDASMANGDDIKLMLPTIKPAND
jgi:hypothetical protein